MKLAILLCAALLSGCSTWGPKEQRAFAFSAACHTYDLIQTDWAMEHGYREMNPLVGEHPSDNTLIVTKAATLVAMWGITELIDQPQRWKVLLLATVPCLWAVHHNYEEGVRP